VSGCFLITRRAFLEALGVGAAGLALGLSTRPAEAAPPGGLRANVFVHVAPDGTVTIWCARSEMGQGVRSSLPVLIADELGADMARVKLAQADGDAAYGDQNTDGSSSVRKAFDKLRLAGATARVMLVAAAAKRWRVPPSSCQATGHAVVHLPTKRKLGFGVLATEAARLPVPDAKSVTLRPRAELAHLGKELPLLDGPDIVTGRARFAADVRLPGMLTAVIARPPVAGGRAARFEATRALAVPGVKQVVAVRSPELPFKFQPLGGVAVVAEHTWAAMQGRAALEITWEPGPNAVYDSKSYRESLAKAVGAPGQVARQVGDADAALARAHKRLEAIYHTPHLAHAPMEPPAAVAHVQGQQCEVWAATQNPQGARTEVAQALGLDEKQVTVHVTLLGGGFGRKSKPDYVVEAALLSRDVGAPVRVQWTREDDIRHDYFHTTAAQRLVAGLDESGKITAWHHRVAFPPIGSTFSGATLPGDGELGQGVLDLPLAIENVRVERCEAKAHARIGWLRSVANIYHAFAVQSFIDELAHARGKDPRENLLEILGPPRLVTLSELGVQKLSNYGQPLEEHPIDTARMREVIERATTLARWDDRKGRALGLAAHRSFLAYVAVVAQVSRDKAERPRVDAAWVVADAGSVVNLERVRAQFEGAFVFGLSLALHGAITMKRGAVEQSNLHDYRLARIAETPRRLHVEVLPSSGPPCGVGEPGVPPVAPAIANAWFALTGTRARALPLIK
jgi:isoquinoline 1-oxidoreductase beta subunit